MPEMHLKSPLLLVNQDLLTLLAERLLKPKKEFKNLKKHETETIFTKMNSIRLVFNLIWLVEILKI